MNLTCVSYTWHTSHDLCINRPLCNNTNYQYILRSSIQLQLNTCFKPCQSVCTRFGFVTLMTTNCESHHCEIQYLLFHGSRDGSSDTRHVVYQSISSSSDGGRCSTPFVSAESCLCVQIPFPFDSRNDLDGKNRYYWDIHVHLNTFFLKMFCRLLKYVCKKYTVAGLAPSYFNDS